MDILKEKNDAKVLLTVCHFRIKHKTCDTCPKYIQCYDNAQKLIARGVSKRTIVPGRVIVGDE